MTPKQKRQRAYTETRRAIREGILSPIGGQVCTDCGSTATVYDHLDYEQPLLVEPVCHSCNIKRGPASPRPERRNKVSQPVIKERKNRRFECRLSEAEFAALQKLAELRGLTMSEVVAYYIVQAAKRARVWE